MQESANLTFDGTTLSTVNDASFHGVTVGLGGGSLTYNTALGVLALAGVNTAQSNTAVGYGALQVNTSGANNTALGTSALTALISGSQNSGIGCATLSKLTTGNNNLAIGYGALANNITGSSNIAIGFNSGLGATGSYLTAIGGSTATYYTSTTESFGSTFIGFGSGSISAGITGHDNTFIGGSSGYNVTSGSQNLCLGTATGYNITSGAQNAAIGHQALYTNLTGSTNIAIGYQSLLLATGSSNVAIGPSSGSAITTGANNVIIGAYTGSAAPISATGSNYIVLSDGAGNIRQTIDNAGNLGIATTSPSYKLDVSGQNRNYGMTITALSTPGAATGVGSSTGGTLAAATYYVKIVAVDAFGGTTAAGTESTGVTTTGTTSSIAYTWAAVTGATSYQIWYSTSAGTEAAYYTSTTASFTLTATSGTAGTLPTANSTGQLLIGQSTTGSKLTVSDSSGGNGGQMVAFTQTSTTLANYAIVATCAGAGTYNTGLYVSAYNGTYNYGVRVPNPPAGANNWGVYVDSAQCYFGNNIGIGVSVPAALIELKAGTATVAPIKMNGGTNLTSAVAGVLEYDGSYFYGTQNTTSGRGFVPPINAFRLTSAGSALGPTIADYFGSTSSINLEATSEYEIDIHAYFLKTTAGTVTWTLTASSAPTLITAWYIANPVTGIAAGAFTSGYTGSAASTTAAFSATGSLTTAVNHSYVFKARIITNAATNFRLQVTSSAGTVTPQAGSYYRVMKISTSTGAFVA